MTEDILAADTDLFLVEVRIKPVNNIKVFVDADQGVSIDKLSRINRVLYKEIETTGMFPNGDFSLEVSSPGLDEPLKLHRQYVKNIGRPVEVILADGIKKEGRLKSVDENGIVVQEEKGKGKKTEISEHRFLFTDIKTTKVQIRF